MLLDGGKIKESKIKLLLSSRNEMQKVIEQARQQALMQMVQNQQMPTLQTAHSQPQLLQTSIFNAQITAGQMLPTNASGQQLMQPTGSQMMQPQLAGSHQTMQSIASNQTIQSSASQQIAQPTGSHQIMQPSAGAHHLTQPNTSQQLTHSTMSHQMMHSTAAQQMAQPTATHQLMQPTMSHQMMQPTVNQMMQSATPQMMPQTAHLMQQMTPQAHMMQNVGVSAVGGTSSSLLHPLGNQMLQQTSGAMGSILPSVGGHTQMMQQQMKSLPVMPPTTLTPQMYPSAMGLQMSNATALMTKQQQQISSTATTSAMMTDSKSSAVPTSHTSSLFLNSGNNNVANKDDKEYLKTSTSKRRSHSKERGDISRSRSRSPSREQRNRDRYGSSNSSASSRYKDKSRDHRRSGRRDHSGSRDDKVGNERDRSRSRDRHHRRSRSKDRKSSSKEQSNKESRDPRRRRDYDKNKENESGKTSSPKETVSEERNISQQKDSRFKPIPEVSTGGKIDSSTFSNQNSSDNQLNDDIKNMAEGRFKMSFHPKPVSSSPAQNKNLVMNNNKNDNCMPSSSVGVIQSANITQNFANNNDNKDDNKVTNNAVPPSMTNWMPPPNMSLNWPPTMSWVTNNTVGLLNNQQQQQQLTAAATTTTQSASSTTELGSKSSEIKNITDSSQNKDTMNQSQFQNPVTQPTPQQLQQMYLQAQLQQMPHLFNQRPPPNSAFPQIAQSYFQQQPPPFQQQNQQSVSQQYTQLNQQASQQQQNNASGSLQQIQPQSSLPSSSTSTDPSSGFNVSSANLKTTVSPSNYHPGVLAPPQFFNNFPPPTSSSGFPTFPTFPPPFSNNNSGTSGNSSSVGGNSANQSASNRKDGSQMSSINQSYDGEEHNSSSVTKDKLSSSNTSGAYNRGNNQSIKSSEGAFETSYSAGPSNEKRSQFQYYNRTSDGGNGNKNFKKTPTTMSDYNDDYHYKDSTSSMRSSYYSDRSQQPFDDNEEQIDENEYDDNYYSDDFDTNNFNKSRQQDNRGRSSFRSRGGTSNVRDSGRDYSTFGGRTRNTIAGDDSRQDTRGRYNNRFGMSNYNKNGAKFSRFSNIENTDTDMDDGNSQPSGGECRDIRDIRFLKRPYSATGGSYDADYSNDFKDRKYFNEPYTSGTCVELRNAPYNLSTYEIRRFFVNMPQINGRNIIFVADERGNRTGSIYLKCGDIHSRDMVLKMNGRHIRNGIPLQIYPLDDDSFDSAYSVENYRKDSSRHHEDVPASVSAPGKSIKWYGVPKGTMKDEILDLFPHYNKPSQIVFVDNADGKSCTCFLKFHNENLVKSTIANKAKLHIRGQPANIVPCREKEFDDAVRNKETNENNSRSVEGSNNKEQKGSEENTTTKVTEKPIVSEKSSAITVGSTQDIKSSAIVTAAAQSVGKKTAATEKLMDNKKIVNTSGSSTASSITSKSSATIAASKTTASSTITASSTTTASSMTTGSSTNVSSTTTGSSKTTASSTTVSSTTRSSTTASSATTTTSKTTASSTNVASSTNTASSTSTVSTAKSASSTSIASSKVIETATNKDEKSAKNVGHQQHQDDAKMKTITRENNKSRSKDNSKVCRITQSDTCIWLKGLSKELTTDHYILDFISTVDIVPTRIHIIFDQNNQPIGEAFCEFDTAEEAITVVSKHNTYYKNCLISVEPTAKDEMMRYLKPPGPLLNNPAMKEDRYYNNRMRPPFAYNRGGGNMSGPSPLGGEFGKPGCVLGMRNVPFQADVEELLNFFGNNFDVRREDVIRRFDDRGRPTGDARIKFKSQSEVHRAMKQLSNRSIRGRHIQLYAA